MVVAIFSILCDFRSNILWNDHLNGDIYRDIHRLTASSLPIGSRIRRGVTSKTHFSSLSVTGIRYRYPFGNVNVDYVYLHTRSNLIMFKKELFA